MKKLSKLQESGLKKIVKKLSEESPFMKPQTQSNDTPAILPHIRSFIMSATPAQLQKMRKELASEINRGLIKDRPNHSYSAELDLIVSRLTDRTKGQ